MATFFPRLQRADHALLAVGQDPRDDLVHACLTADGFGGALVVAGEHDDADAMLKLRTACGLSGLMASATAIMPSSRPLRLNNNGVLPLAAEVFGLARMSPETWPPGDKVQAAAGKRLTVQHGSQAVTGQRGKVGNFLRLQAQVLSPLYHGLGQGVLALFAPGH